MIEFFLILDGNKQEIGCEIRANGSDFFIEFAQEQFKGVRIGKYPIGKYPPGVELTRVPAVLVGER